MAFAWNEEGYGRHARLTLPAPVCGESLDDIPAALDGVTATFRLAAPMVTPQAAVVNPAEFIAKLAGLDAGQAFRERADAIHQLGRGDVFTPADGNTAALKSLTADDFWKALNAGACWMDERAKGSPDANRLKASCKQGRLPHDDPAAGDRVGGKRRAAAGLLPA